jgi:hypothetical protein
VGVELPVPPADDGRVPEDRRFDREAVFSCFRIARSSSRGRFGVSDIDDGFFDDMLELGLAVEAEEVEAVG